MQYSVVRLINDYMLVHCKKHLRGVQKVEKGAFSKQVTHPYSGSKKQIITETILFSANRVNRER